MSVTGQAAAAANRAGAAAAAAGAAGRRAAAQSGCGGGASWHVDVRVIGDRGRQSHLSGGGGLHS